jgi:hypothetical protein
MPLQPPSGRSTITLLLERTYRVDRDALAALLLSIRERSRLELAEELASDFKTFDVSRSGTMRLAEFQIAVQTLFPYTFTESQIQALYFRGLFLENRFRQQSNEGQLLTTWNQEMFVDSFMLLSENLQR